VQRQRQQARPPPAEATEADESSEESAGHMAGRRAVAAFTTARLHA